MYEWDVTLIEVVSPDDFDEYIKPELKRLGFLKDEQGEVRYNMTCTNGGDHFFNGNKKASMIILYPMTSIKNRNSILCHEKRHMEDRILSFCRIDDLEAAAYLAGYLAKKML
jgi:hypothetical protein